MEAEAVEAEAIGVEADAIGVVAEAIGVEAEAVDELAWLAHTLHNVQEHHEN